MVSNINHSVVRRRLAVDAAGTPTIEAVDRLLRSTFVETKDWRLACCCVFELGVGGRAKLLGDVRQAFQLHMPTLMAQAKSNACQGPGLVSSVKAETPERGALGGPPPGNGSCLPSTG